MQTKNPQVSKSANYEKTTSSISIINKADHDITVFSVLWN